MSSNLADLSLNSFSNNIRSSVDYKIFKHHIIHPSIINSNIQAQLGPPHVSISFAPNRSSSEDYSQFFEDTKFTQTIPSKSYPSLPDSDDFSCEPPVHLWGYFSPKCVDYFIWEYGAFKEGATVILGDNLRLAKITEAVGVGRNFIKFGVEMLESPSKDEVPVRRVIVSCLPDGFCLTRSQRFKHYFFHWFLMSMKDIVDVERVWDESEVMAKDDLNADYGKLLGEMFGFMMWE
ncbi:hypothetical protein PILCRDRAFT_11409 [Piloderma croceum F 1598]|uniref:Uncharacterized protein n=1 Tax=Piloderma croceum (strain F 1598) TaxID=765440 RepID=A0A0C3F091_PILCF|nr:hypothetical protein PILCRDRAFT_11409 [Piloderma croceum F 1598]